jgi:hypothetical protein
MIANSFTVEKMKLVDKLVKYYKKYRTVENWITKHEDKKVKINSYIEHENRYSIILFFCSLRWFIEVDTDFNNLDLFLDIE